jgi:hypothetical protein
LALLVSVPGLGASAPVAKSWQAPFAGKAFHSAATNTAGCHTASALEQFNLTTGHVTGSTKMTASSCHSSSSTSYAVQSGETGVVLNHFSGFKGKHTVTVNWTVHAIVALSLSGTSCVGASDDAKIYLEAGWANLSGNATSIPGAAWAGVTHFINTTVSKSWTIAQKVILSWVVKLALTDSYVIFVIWHWHVSADVLNPPYSCSGVADLRPTSGSSVGTLARVTLS